MTKRSNAFDGECPDCGRVFTLLDLKRMAEGDGWKRYLAVRLEDGSRAVVSFNDLDPTRMVSWLHPELTPANEAADEIERLRRVEVEFNAYRERMVAAAPYPFCRHPEKCIPTGRCESDWACND